MEALFPNAIIHVHQGDVAVDGQKTLTTLLGSCVSVCLWDKKRKIGGMNHIVLPVLTNNLESSPRFGKVAMELLLAKMLQAGCRKSDLQAAMFGGASGLMGRKSLFNVGLKNVEVAECFLRENQIPLVRKETGGVKGRKITFWPQTGKLSVSFLKGNVSEVENP